MGTMNEYELDTAVVVEDVILGERFRFEAGPGRVRAKSERDELALERLVAEHPTIARRVKPAPKSTKG
jgi:hypothetical protein